MRAKSSFSFIVISIAVIAACLLLVSAGILSLTITWDPCALISGVIVLPLPMILAIQQYRGTFRSHLGAATTSCVMLFGTGGLALVAFAVTLGDMISNGVRIPWMSLLLPMLAVGITGCRSAWMNLSWSRQLKRSAMTGATVPELVSLSNRDLIAAVAAMAFVAALTTWFVRSTLPRYAENVSRDRAPFGPAEATEISFCKGFRGTIAYEFSIDEKGFVAWVTSGIGSLESEAANISLQPISSPHTITRFYASSKDLAGPHSITITDGLSYDWSKEDRGVHAAFDRANGRAYYYAHFH